MFCPKCAFASPESAAFCPQCGGSLDPDRLVPEADAQYSSRAERRRLTVMFCDLVGSTELSGQLDPEELHDLMREYQRVCADVINRHAGHIAQIRGDGLLVYFGYPIAHEDDAQRAVRAGLEIVAALARLPAQLAKTLRVRVAVHTGLVVVGQLGDETNPNAMAIAGETPNIAARLQGIAEPDTVIISAPTHRLIDGFFRCRSLGAHTLKGVAAPIELYSVLEESDIQSRFDQAVATGLTPFVSREAEVAHLVELWERARDGAGNVVLLSGEAGIGKSRLLRVLKEGTTGEAVTDLEARCSPYYQGSALHPIIGFFQHLLQFQRDDSAETRLATLERVLDNFGFPLSETVPLFAALLSFPAGHRYQPLAMTPQRQKQKTFEAMVAWLLKAAERRPTRVVVEDIHWADPSTLEFLGLLIDQVSQARLFVALVFRSEFLLPWRSQPHVTTVTLGRLSSAATERMIDSIAGGKKLPPDLIQEIVKKTEGVPLFVEELTRMVLESGMLRERDDHYELTSPVFSLAIPSTLYESLMARLDRLGNAKEVAQLGAAIGKEFSYELLRAISPIDETKLSGALNRLVDAELLEQHLLPSETNYSFRHALIRDAAYESLLRTKRRHYHRKIAEVLQARFGETVEPELLASHLTEAGMIEEAIPCWQRAGQRALERSANQEAIRHLTKGLEFLSGLPETPPHLQEELLLRVTLGAAVMVAKGFGSLEAQSVYARARELCQQVSGSPLVFSVFWALWVFHAARGEHGEAREAGEECLRLAQEARDPALLLEAHHALGVSLQLLGEFVQSLEHLEQSIAIYDPRQHAALAYVSGQDPGVAGLVHQAWALWFLGYPDQSRKRIHEALTRARELPHPVTKAAAANFASWVYQLLRDPQAAREHAEEAVSVSTALVGGSDMWKAMGVIGQGWALTEQGLPDDGIVRLHAGLTALRSTGARVLLPYFLALLAQAYARAGQVEEGLSILKESQVALDKGAERWFQAELHRLKGELILRRPGPRPDERGAEECFRQALAIAREQRAKSLELRAAMSLSRLCHRLGKNSEAHRTLADVYDWFTEGFGTPDLQEARTLLEQLSRD
jgi:predicted ATPase/class 3 adenylate cyclase